MTKIVAITGNSAVAEAMRAIEPDVVAAYPITPQIAIIENFADYVAGGNVKTEFVAVESEHSAMSACVGASAAGARAMTATSSQGLALMWEILYIASGLRLPIVMFNVSRTLSAPINIHCDHSDSMGARDSGWIQIFSESAQEAYDNTIQAVRIAEHEDVLLPVMVMMDGYTISHSIDRVNLLDDDDVKSFTGERTPLYPLLDPEKPVTWGAFDSLYGYYFEFKRAQIEAMKRSKNVIVNVGKEYGLLSGRNYGLFEDYRLADAEIGIVILGSAAGTAKVVVDEMREEGVRAGLLKLRVFRPFPVEELVSVLSRLKAVAVLDRSDGMAGFGGPVFNEIQSALYETGGKVPVVNFVYGLGGRDLGPEEVRRVFQNLQKIVETGKIHKKIAYLGLRE
ncbi:MAG: pyruvate ferredoxin oxidoreductase [Actinomycetota bacterium]